MHIGTTLSQFIIEETRLYPDLADSMCSGTNRAPDMLGFAFQRHAIGVHRYRKREADHNR